MRSPSRSSNSASGTRTRRVFEAVEHAMALLQAPRRAETDGIEVREERSFEEFRDSLLVTLAAFEAPEAMCEEVMASAEQRYAEHRTPGNPSHVYVALLDGRVVGSATGAFADAGVNLFGGAVLPEARGRGVYSALIAARWDAAVARGTPALTIQAGRMSKPIVERFGFEAVDAVRLFVDELG
jgi:GNAT superfamily N-acetyltransferase